VPDVRVRVYRRITTKQRVFSIGAESAAKIRLIENLLAKRRLKSVQGGTRGGRNWHLKKPGPFLNWTCVFMCWEFPLQKWITEQSSPIFST
jgi:hypothetical protein